MSANRKLQTEIDRTLKKVEEGVEVFDEVWDKVYSATQQNQKEKYEVDLKKEIKKLQRHRDQIKTWAASSDVGRRAATRAISVTLRAPEPRLSSAQVKDKRALATARKLIETKMEQFKVCEKETKTKTYSKEGLAREARVDPHEAARRSTRAWLRDAADRLGAQVDAAEADVERLSAGRGAKKHRAEVEALEASVRRHKWHVARLEQIARLLDNSVLTPERVDEVREDVEYYIDANQEPDFADAYDETMDIFEGLELGAPREARDEGAVARGGGRPPTTTTASTPRRDASATARCSRSASARRSASRARPRRSRSGGAADDRARRRLEAAGAGDAGAGAASQAGRGARRARRARQGPGGAGAGGAAGRRGAGRLEPRRHPQAAHGPPGATAGGAGAVRRRRAPGAAAGRRAGAAGAAGAPAATRPTRPAAARRRRAAGGRRRRAPSSRASHGAAAVAARAAGAAAAPAIGPAPAAPPRRRRQPRRRRRRRAPRRRRRRASALLRAGRLAEPLLDRTDPAAADDTYARLLDARAAAAAAGRRRGLGGRPARAPRGGRGAAPRALALSMRRAPRKRDAERPRQYVPRNPYATPAAFPTQPAAVFDGAAVFARLGTDTLFFVFYYQQGTYQRPSPRASSKQSWRYHKKYMAWFQRPEEPKATTRASRARTNFDYETGWCQRIK